MVDKKWLWEEIDKKEVNKLVQEHKISPFLAELLIKRGIASEDIPVFLEPKLEHLGSPFLMKDMEKALQRIQRAIASKEKILIFGDYDVDGITSTTVLFLGLNQLGANVSYYIPNRDEGYGLNVRALDENISTGVSLVITVDCGISAVDEVAFCNEKGVDCIITDHHLPPEILPKAYAIINPKQQGCPYKFKDLAGVGLSFKLVKALFIAYEASGWEDYLDIVALGTVADLVPLLGENRTIVSLGLEKMNEGLRLPLKMLGEVAGITHPIDSYHLGFAFGPRLNAAGRLESPKEAIELMLARDEQKAFQLATFLNEQNRDRQGVEQSILDQCIQMVEAMNLVKTKVLVLGNENWHHGVIGIVASRLVEKYHRPVIMLSIKDDMATGSCRSVQGFHLYEALSYCEDLLVRYGGHAMAAGLTVEKGNIEDFREKINIYALENNIDDYLKPKLFLDMSLDPNNLDLKMLEEISKLKPFGQSNPAPVFRIENLNIAKFNLVGQQKNHLKVDFRLGNMYISSIGFKKADLIPRIYGKKTVSFAGYLDKNTYNGNTSLQLRILDLKDEMAVSHQDTEQHLELIDIRNKGLKDFLSHLPPSNKKYLLYTNEYYKNNIDDFYLSLSNVIIKGYEDEAEKGIPIFWHLPLRQSQFLKKLQAYKDIGANQIIIAYSQEETALIPSRNLLVCLYKAIQDLNNQGKEATIENIKGFLAGNFFVDYLVDRGLNILRECNLLKFAKDCWYILEVQEKVDFKKTAIYKRYLKQHETFIKWQEFALKISLTELIKSQQFIIEEEKIWI